MVCNVWKIFSPGNKLKAEGVGQQTGKNDGSGDDLHEIEVFHEISVDDKDTPSSLQKMMKIS